MLQLYTIQGELGYYSRAATIQGGATIRVSTIYIQYMYIRVPACVHKLYTYKIEPEQNIIHLFHNAEYPVQMNDSTGIHTKQVRTCTCICSLLNIS